MIENLEKQLVMLQSRAGVENETAEILVQLSHAWIEKDLDKSLEYALQSVQLSDKVTSYITQSKLLLNIAFIYHKLNDHHQAIDYYDQLLHKALKNADQKMLAEINNNIGIEYWHLSEYKKSENYLNEGLRISKEINDLSLMAESYSGLGLLNWKLGNPSVALKYYHKSLKLQTELGNERALAILNNYIGIIYKNQGKITEALEYYNTSYKIFNQLDDKVYMAKLLNNLGNLHLYQGRNQQAIQHYLQSLTISEEINDIKSTASILNNIGLIYFNMENFEEGLKFHQRALDIREALDNKSDIAHSLNNIGLAYQKLDRRKESLTYTQRALAIEIVIGDKIGIACSYSLMGLLWMELKDYKRAKLNYQKSLEVYELLGDKMGISANLINLGGIHLEMNDLHEAEALLLRGLKLARELQAENLIRDCYGSLTELYKALEDYRNAIEYMTLHVEIRDKINSEESEQSISSLQTRYELEKQEKEAEIYRLKNIELATANNELRLLKHELENRVEESIKEIRKKDTLLITQSRLAEMGKMIGFIAHQWKQPLNIVNVIAQSIEDAYNYDTLDEVSIEKFTTNIMSQIKYMSDTIDDFRNFFKPGKSVIRFNVKEIILITINLMGKSFEQNNIDLTLELADDCWIEGYPNEFTQAVLNILNNSRDACNRLKESDHKEVCIKLTSCQDNCSVIIQDTAAGIPDNIIGHIFEPYYTTKTDENGTGLGLFMSKTIIEENMKGSLSVSNTKKGAEFKIVFNSS
jgi:signal transduction histidine kinase/Tfp pilus assembly protein PilF